MYVAHGHEHVLCRGRLKEKGYSDGSWTCLASMLSQSVFFSSRKICTSLKVTAAAAAGDPATAYTLRDCRLVLPITVAEHFPTSWIFKATASLTLPMLTVPPILLPGVMRRPFPRVSWTLSAGGSRKTSRPREEPSAEPVEVVELALSVREGFVNIQRANAMFRVSSGDKQQVGPDLIERHFGISRPKSLVDFLAFL